MKKINCHLNASILQKIWQHRYFSNNRCTFTNIWLKRFRDTRSVSSDATVVGTPLPPSMVPLARNSCPCCICPAAPLLKGQPYSAPNHSPSLPFSRTPPSFYHWHPSAGSPPAIFSCWWSRFDYTFYNCNVRNKLTLLNIFWLNYSGFVNSLTVHNTAVGKRQCY